MAREPTCDRVTRETHGQALLLQQLGQLPNAVLRLGYGHAIAGHEDDLSGGEQDTSEGAPVTPKGKPANGGLRDNTKSAFLIAILIVAFGVLAIAAIAITAAAFSNAPPGSPPHAATTAGANDTADVEVISRALADHTDWLIWQLNDEGGGVWRARAEEKLSSKPL